MVLLQQMVMFFIIIIVGLACSRLGLWNDETVDRVNAIIVTIIGPCMIMSAGFNQEANVSVKTVLMALGLGCVAHLFLILCAEFMCRLPGIPLSDRPNYKTMTIISNIGFIGIPIANAVYGPTAAIYMSLFVFPNTFLCYSLIISILRKANGGASIGQRVGIVGTLKHLVNPGNVACVIAIFFCLTHLPVPNVISMTVSSIGSMTGVLTMMVLGHSLSKIELRSFFTNKSLLLYSLLRQTLIPCLGMMLVMPLHLDSTILITLSLFFAMPAGVMNVILSQQYGGNYLLASRGVLITTILSIFSIPVIPVIFGLN